QQALHAQVRLRRGLSPVFSRPGVDGASPPGGMGEKMGLGGVFGLRRTLEGLLGDRPAFSCVAVRVPESRQVTIAPRHEIPPHSGHPPVQFLPHRATDHDETWGDYPWRVTGVREA